MSDDGLLQDLPRFEKLMGHEYWHAFDAQINAAKTALAEADPAQFDELSPLGKLQQLEAAEAEMLVAKGRFADAAKVAVRMIVEDE